jgi:hypothetical protein
MSVVCGLDTSDVLVSRMKEDDGEENDDEEDEERLSLVS